MFTRIMDKKNKNHYDIFIAGAGFAGSLTALILQKCGFKICLVEKSKHPRFAIGESSTPVADMILRKLSLEYDLPWLYDFSRYGSWQQSHPEIICGLKRGFSFYKHHPGEFFFTDENHSNELLVAASSSDMESDTNWLRADVDNFFVEKVKESGIEYFDLTQIENTNWNGQWKFEINHLNNKQYIHASFFIDATGSSGLMENLLGIESSPRDFLTDSYAMFSHFDRTPRWTEMLQKSGIPTGDYPYNPDHSALHQILDEGWLWMLRFNNDRISMGFVLDGSKRPDDSLSTEEIWKGLLKKYPAINCIFKDAGLAEVPGKIIHSKRLQRKLNQGCGPGWVAVPNTIGFVDPLFSSGIAHSLSGIEKLIPVIKKHWGSQEVLLQHLKEYEQKVFEEIQFIDLLIAGCYKTFPHFELFKSWSMLYFAATIAHEKSRMHQPDPGYFMNADNPGLKNIIDKTYDELLQIISSGDLSDETTQHFSNKVRERIKPWNTAGLMEPEAKNMYWHTVARV